MEDAAEQAPHPRAAAIASLTPLEHLDQDPFLVDTRSQQDMCARWADAHDHVITRELLLHGLAPDHPELWADFDAGRVDLFLTPSRRVLDQAVTCAEEFTALCARRGARVVTADLAEPQYGPRSKARVHRRLSMPTAGYDGC
ncbi:MULTISPECIES: hypothetical protein [Streptomyces]|uniref:Uncharacterized protein n=4 Tax=Streptomyces TaxID=1883 RepID=A0A8H9HFM3_9ACTN|nr:MULTISPECIES: hypothetical protein [Streptomyces]NEE33962.1 hypothetical protein [Streptomyces sp. SID7982]MBL3803509.1 hypothetical protein [Streptomyces sp. BRB081]MDQ0292562.1 hypothetical protein [Streptomyces sp. DSM 41037]NEC11608.1 hypothetical protein [Streptomyces sp. SID8014]PJM83908.1 hypothetical protein CH313_08000 [Streptomyces sp. TSRI0384-2]